MGKRFWLGVLLLGVLLVSGLLTSGFLYRSHMPVAQKLQEAADAALSGDPEKASQLVLQAQKTWEQRRKLTAALTDHNPGERIESLFSGLSVELQTGSSVEIARTCRELAALVDATATAQVPLWWNLFWVLSQYSPL